MNLEGILAIGGKPGLYKLVAQSRGGVIVESMDDGKRFPVSSANNVSALNDIAIYTYGEEVPLKDVFQKIAEKEDYGKTIDHKASIKELKDYMTGVLPDYDQERVYQSDLKKLFMWYNSLHDKGLITPDTEEEKSGEKPEGENPAEGE